MIQLTVERIMPLIDMQNIYIITNRDYKQLVRDLLPEVPEGNITFDGLQKIQHISTEDTRQALEQEFTNAEAMSLAIL